MLFKDLRKVIKVWIANRDSSSGGRLSVDSQKFCCFFKSQLNQIFLGRDAHAFFEKVRQVAAVDIQAISYLPDRDAIDILSIDAVDCLLHIISVRFCIVQQDTKKFPQLCA